MHTCFHNLQYCFEHVEYLCACLQNVSVIYIDVNQLN
jgi:hypothetical protein